MSSKAGICSISLGRLGQRAIRSFDENNKLSRNCEAAYDFYRLDYQTKYDWGFTTAYTELSLLDETGTNDLPYVYALPSDCLRPREVRPHINGTKWIITQGTKIFTNATGLSLLYSKNEENTAKFPAYFSTALAAAVAAQIAMSVTQKMSVADKMEEWRNTALDDGLEVDASTNFEYRRDQDNPDKDTFVSPDGSLEPSDWRQTNA